MPCAGCVVADRGLEPGFSVEFALQAMEAPLLSRCPGSCPVTLQWSSPWVWLPPAQQTHFHSLSKSHLLCQVIPGGSPITATASRHTDTCTSILAPLSDSQLIFSKPSPPPGDLPSSPHLTARSSPFSLPMNAGVRGIDISQGMSYRSC